MTVTAPQKTTNFYTAAALLALLLLLPGRTAAQEEVASSLRRYKDREVSTGYYEEYEVLPSRQRRPVVSVPGLRRGRFPYSPTAARVRIRTRLADSHQGIKFYNVLRCEYCHADEAKDIHTVRANLTCRQCHGGEPIASIAHIYSPMNPIRRHAYVCAKCHEGASASFASYIVHEPAAGSFAARKEFPLLYYSYWFMLVLLVGTLAFFIPHTLLVGAREVFERLKRLKGKDERDSEQDAEQDIERREQRDDEQAAEQDIERRDVSDDERHDTGKQDDADLQDAEQGIEPKEVSDELREDNGKQDDAAIRDLRKDDKRDGNGKD